MSLTETEGVFGGIHEDALNDLLRAFFTRRPRYLHYASPGIVQATTLGVTQMSAIAFPNIPGGIEWEVELAIPVVDLHRQTQPLPPELTLGAGQLSVRTIVEICLSCRHDRIDVRPLPPTHGRDPRLDDFVPKDGKRRMHTTCCRLGVFAVGHLERVITDNGEPGIAIAVDRIELVDIRPDEVESLLECLLLMILRAVLASVRLPLSALRAGAFPLQLVRGPEIEDDQLKVYGTL